MILEIWGLKTWTEVRACFEYIRTPLKTEMSKIELHEITLARADGDESTGHVIRSIKYDPEEGCFHGHFISGYRCHPEHWEADFESIRLELGADLQGNIAYHIVQSFPEDLEVSGEEAHQAGLDLCKRLGNHAAIVATHVRPVFDEEGVERGRCKHSHVITSAYIHPECLDPAHPNVRKFHECHESREHLRVLNDEIAIDHGWPILRTPDTSRPNSFTEHEAIQDGTSWKERIRADIDQIKSTVSSIEELADRMQEKGYSISGRWVTLTTPDGAHRVRTKKLGMAYTQLALENFWHEQELKKADEERRALSTALYIARLARQNPDYTIAIPLGNPHRQPRPMYQLRLCRDDISMSALESYFDPSATYDILDQHGGIVTRVSGKELLLYYEHRGYENVLEAELRIAEVGIPLPNRVPAKPPTGEVYTDKKLTSRTGRAYAVPLYDERRKRKISILEAIFRLAIAILLGEPEIFYNMRPMEVSNAPFYVKTDWKLQRLYDAAYLVTYRGIKSPKELEKHIGLMENEKFRAGVLKNAHADTKRKMAPLMDAIEEYERIRERIRTLASMPDSPEKNAHAAEVQDLQKRYQTAVSVLKKEGITTLDDIKKVKETWKKIDVDIESASYSYTTACHDLDRLRETEHMLLLAQNPRFLYGPEYPVPEELDIVPVADGSVVQPAHQPPHER